MKLPIQDVRYPVASGGRWNGGDGHSIEIDPNRTSTVFKDVALRSGVTFHVSPAPVGVEIVQPDNAALAFWDARGYFESLRIIEDEN